LGPDNEETTIIERSGRSTYPEENSGQTSGATPLSLRRNYGKDLVLNAK